MSQQTQSQERDAPHHFIKNLAALEDAESRRVVARLRQAAAAAPSLTDFAGRVMEVVYTYTPPGTFSRYRSFREEAYALTAYGFALHKQKYRGGAPPGMSSKKNFGGSLRALKDNIGDKGSDSLDTRFHALLDSPFEDLFYHLPHLVRRIAHHEEDIGINHTWLLKDLLQWNHPDRFVQRNWSRQYWQHLPANTDLETNQD